MKTLMLLRHAKPSWDDAELDDLDRPLTARGRADAVRMGQEISRRGWLPDQTLLSPAERCCQTWELAASSWERKVPARPMSELYLATPETLLQTITQLSGPGRRFGSEGGGRIARQVPDLCSCRSGVPRKLGATGHVARHLDPLSQGQIAASLMQKVAETNGSLVQGSLPRPEGCRSRSPDPPARYVAGRGRPNRADSGAGVASRPRGGAASPARPA